MFLDTLEFTHVWFPIAGKYTRTPALSGNFTEGGVAHRDAWTEPVA
jgi:hypothetical protein